MWLRLLRMQLPISNTVKYKIEIIKNRAKSICKVPIPYFLINNVRKLSPNDHPLSYEAASASCRYRAWRRQSAIIGMCNRQSSIYKVLNTKMCKVSRLSSRLFIVRMFSIWSNSLSLLIHYLRLLSLIKLTIYLILSKLVSQQGPALSYY